MLVSERGKDVTLKSCRCSYEVLVSAQPFLVLVLSVPSIQWATAHIFLLFFWSNDIGFYISGTKPKSNNINSAPIKLGQPSHESKR